MTNDFTWSVRVQWMNNQQKVYARNQEFTVGQQASFRDSDPHPSAVEYLLGAFGGDLMSGFQFQAARSQVTIEAMELTLSGQLNNVLTHLGVVGEAGHPGFERIEGTLYVMADVDEETIDAIWRTALQRSPLVNTLERCVKLSLNFRVL